MNLISNFIDFLYPKTSLISGERIDDENSNEFINDFELNSLKRVTPSDLIDLSIKTDSDYSYSYFTFYENDDFSKLIYMLKYGGMKKLGEFLGEISGAGLKTFIEDELNTWFDYIIPVPLYKTKLRERGYNQSEYIGRGVSKATGIGIIPDLATRVRHTTTQTKLSREERIKNVKNAFEINSFNKDKIKGKKIIIADDVVTTGSTMNELVKVLQLADASEILCFSIAMAR
ncbi:MAG: ComF family protein [Ignavibacteria bacterium]|nr:ComF family protein [Ignavibacteria bacterium]